MHAMLRLGVEAGEVLEVVLSRLRDVSPAVREEAGQVLREVPLAPDFAFSGRVLETVEQLLADARTELEARECAGCLLARRPEKPATPPPPEDEAEPLARARLERILANIDLYDGTPAGQQRVE